MLWHHLTRNSSTEALSAASLQPELYLFAARLVRDKAEERVERVVKALEDAVRAELAKVAERAAAAERSGVFHPDGNAQRAQASGRLALVKSLNLPKFDARVLRDMLLEKSVADAAADAEAASVAAVLAGKERADWEARQNEQLVEFSLKDLKDRAVRALAPPTEHFHCGISTTRRTIGLVQT